MKKIIVALLAALMVFSMTACSSDSGTEETTSPTEESAPAQEEAAAENDNETMDIAVLIKSTDSAFWQKVREGAEAYASENEGITVTVQGPASEADIEESISLLENVILSSPDAIVLASNADSGANAALAEASAAGIPVVTIDTQLPSETIACHLATDNKLGGSLAAEAMVKSLQDNGKELKGKIALVSAVAGVQTVLERDSGFTEKLKELAPDIEILEPIYCDNEIDTAMQTTENLITAHGDELIGIYADNNHMGDGVSRAVEQAAMENQITIIAFDDDEEEITALKKNVIKALIIQDSYNMGYMGVEYAVKAAKGETMESFADTGVNVTWPEDVES